MRCPYCGSEVEAGNDICLNCERPLDARLMREQAQTEQRAQQEKVAHEQKVAELVADPAVEQKVAQMRNPISYMLSISPIVLGLALASVLIVLLMGVNFFYAAVAIVVAIVSATVLIVAAFMYGSSKKHIRRVLAAPLVHWTYNEHEWQQFTAHAWRRDIKTDAQVAGILMGITLALSLVSLLVGHGAPGALILAAVLLGASLVISLSFFLKDVLALKIRRRRGNNEAYVSLDGVILGGWYLSPLDTLYKVEYKAGDLALLRLFTKRQGRYNTYTVVIEVPVPRGREAEAAQLDQRLPEKVIWVLA